MAWQFDPDRPIYKQLREHILLKIVSEEYAAGTQLPTVRDLAEEAAVNPNTLQKALLELERDGLVYAQRTSGRFVTEDKALIKQAKNDLAKEQIDLFLKKNGGHRLYPAGYSRFDPNHKGGKAQMSILTSTNLTKVFGKTIALNKVSLDVEAGRVIGLLGPNGSGKTTFLKLCNGLLTPTGGSVKIADKAPGIETKAIVSFLPEDNYFSDWMKVKDMVSFFADFYTDFDAVKAEEMLKALDIEPTAHIKALSKGTKEKVQLILVMARKAKLYLLDEPIGGVDPAVRDYILRTIISNYNPEASVIISTHLIADVEQVLDEVIFLKEGEIALHEDVDTIREEKGMSVDQLFREVFKC